MAATADRDREPAAAAALAIVCGGGPLPFAVADAAVRGGRPVVMFPIEGWADRAQVARYPHHWIPLGRFGRFVARARAAGCRDVVFIGTVLRPSLREIGLDWTTLRLLPRLYRLFRGGDDHLLSGLAGIFEEHGFRLVGAHEIAPESLVPQGTLGRHAPSARDHADIVQGLALIETMGAFDVGQAVVVAERRVLAVEAAEGTDAMLERVGALRGQGRLRSAPGIGVLIKAPKPGQDRRVDLPSIGPSTVRRVAEVGLAGLAVRAGEVIVAEPAAMIAAADAAGVFVAGIGADDVLS
jgi:DUF1009 family protein